MCGIFGIITPKPRKFDLRTFCVLGVNNDSRGGDSCGIFIDKKYEYGVNEYKLFYNFFPKSKLLASTNKCQIALGHCRKASVGAINATNAQPVIIKNSQSKEVEFVLIHNGTIINYRELANKYIPNIDIKEMTDSQVMAQIFYHKGYDALGEYIGAGAFVMVDYRTKTGHPQILFFKGKSKSTQYSVSTTIERPLYCSYSSTEFIFSSIMEFLKALRPNREVLTITPNQLIELGKDGNLYIVKEYNRENLVQTKSSHSNSSNNYTSESNYTRISKWRSYPSYYDYYDDYYNDCRYNKYWNDVIDMDQVGIYWVGENKAHGIYWADILGNITTNKMTEAFQVAFWRGVLLKNSSCFMFLNKMCQELKCSQGELLNTYQDLVHYLSPIACWKTDKGQWVTSDTPSSNFLYTGSASFPFTTTQIQFKGGKIDYYTDGIPYKSTLLDLKIHENYKIEDSIIAQYKVL